MSYLSSYIFLYGDPIFSLVIVTKDKTMFTDLLSYRPNPLITLHENINYKAHVFFEHERLLSGRVIDVARRIVVGETNLINIR